MEFRVDDLTGAKVIALIQEHLHGMAEHTPPESVHALNLDGLKHPDVTFWSVWEQDELLGIGALKELDPTHGEIKSMRTSAAHLRKGVGKAILEHIIAVAKERGYTRLSLETGSRSMPSFDPARKLYEQLDFHYCGPFADYAEDPYSDFMTKEL
ncbi:GNAT family N-acetyltransferase [Paenibacillus montanisoli]|uniref:GNAT family N-acetyltransferase n=1 Tax=Paenibacillus montanisoli TaxID=2081970 RepID=A0A328TYW2_9BACL|nr:GNAT family N-acetyltransferase [Paenibacillus montanisoli]RAP75580.1 GNAT family N-acetyltransferase [Paenibacillus montanisoli]